MGGELAKETRSVEQFACFRTQVETDIKNSTVPVGNASAVKLLFGEDSEPLEFVNTVKIGEDNPVYPWGQFGDKVVLTERWAQSFADAVNDKPAWLYLRGHEDVFQFKTRAVSAGYIVGAKVEGDSLYLRNRFLPRTDPGEQDVLKQTLNEINAGLLSTSTGDLQRYEWKEVLSDSGSMDIVAYAVESVKGQSNALVESDMTASEAEIIEATFREHIGHRTGNYDPKGDVKFDDKGDVTMDGKPMNVEELIAAFNSAKESGGLAVSDFASQVGLNLKTEEDEQAIAKLKEAEAKLGDLEKVSEEIATYREQAFSGLKQKYLKEAFQDDELVENIGELFTLSEGNEESVKAEVERLKGMKIVQSMMKQKAAGINFNPGGETDEPGTNGPAKTGEMEA